MKEFRYEMNKTIDEKNKKKSRKGDCFQERAREPIRGDKLSKKPMKLIDA